jgi:type VI secretion system protein ImpF
MAENVHNELLQPSLLDRLTDNEPDNRKETRDERVIDIRRLREIVLRDLSWLLNTNNSESWLDAELFPNVARSTLNYGVREVAGDFAGKNRAEAIRRSIRRSIENFEPRLKPDTVDVTLRTADTARETIVSFEIRADMWAQPIPMELYLRTEIDITTGETSLERLM